MNRGLGEVTEEATETSGHGTFQAERTASVKGPKTHELEKQGGQNRKIEGQNDRR